MELFGEKQSDIDENKQIHKHKKMKSLVTAYSGSFSVQTDFKFSSLLHATVSPETDPLYRQKSYTFCLG